MKSSSVHLKSTQETIEYGQQLGRILPPNSVISLSGDLGAGKTTLIKGIASGAVNCSEYDVSSPTFVYLNIYGTEKKLFHFDLYRLRDIDEFLSMGFEEMFEGGGICCIEWAEKIESLLPPHTICVDLAHSPEGGRRLIIYE